MLSDILEQVDILNIQEKWDKIGYSDEEKTAEQKKLRELVIGAIRGYEDELESVFVTFRGKIDAVSTKYTEIMKAFDISEEVIASKLAEVHEQNLKESLKKITADYVAFVESHSGNIDQLTRSCSVCLKLFERLEIPEEQRGEFAVVGHQDFTDARIHRFAQKIISLEKEVNDRIEKIEKHTRTIKELSHILELPLPQIDNQDISLSSMRRIEEMEADLLKQKIERQDLLEKKKVELTKLWNILNVPNSQRHSFLNQFKTIGDSVLLRCDQEIEKLRGKRQEHLPEIVEDQKHRIRELEEEMHLSADEKSVIDIEDQDLNETYDKLDKILEAVTQKYNAAKQFIELINRRTELLEENKSLEESQKKIEAAMKKKKPVDQKQVNKDEQARRRIKSLLPRLERKLLIMLIEYETKMEHPFTWDGEPYTAQLSHVVLSDVEKRQAKGLVKKRPLSSRRSSQPTATRISQKSARRCSENAKASVNVCVDES